MIDNDGKFSKNSYQYSKHYGKYQTNILRSLLGANMIEANSKLECIHVHFKDRVTSSTLDLLTGHPHYILMYVHPKCEVTNCKWEVL